MLSYSVDDFELQEKISCSSDNPVCVDWVDHHIGNIAQSHKVCGSGEAGEVHSDGADSMLVEFVANRDSVLLKGFQYTVTCIVPEFDNNAVRLGAVPATAAQRRAAGRCTSPDGRQRRQIYHSPPVCTLANQYVCIYRCVGVSDYSPYNCWFLVICIAPTVITQSISMSSPPSDPLSGPVLYP